MTEYKIGDKVLVEATIEDLISPNKFSISIWGHFYAFKAEQLRPYTPRQEFEYGEEVEVSDGGSHWFRALFIGRTHRKGEKFSNFAVNVIDGDGLCIITIYAHCRKPQPRDTITIGNTTYDKAEFENAVKDLKPIG